jgi:hypothetical protein
MEDVVRQPVVLIDEDLDAVAGGNYFHGVHVDVHISSSPVQINESQNLFNTGNNQNNGSGNIGNS